MLTLKRFRELTKDLPEETVINTTMDFGKEWSIRGSINCVHLCPLEHTYADEPHITLTQTKTESEELVVKDLVAKNKWETRNGQETK